MPQDKPISPIVPPPISAENRAVSSNFLNDALSKPPTMGMAKAPTTVWTAKNPPKGSTSSLQDDPQMELAVHLLQMRYPHLFKGVSNIVIGSSPTNPNEGGRTVQDPISGGAQISLRHSKGDFASALDILQHELSHTVGFEDNPSSGPSAYDVSNASFNLHRDISLPKDKK